MSIWAASYRKVGRSNRFIEGHGYPDGKLVFDPVLHALAFVVGEKRRKARQYIKYAR